MSSEILDVIVVGGGAAGYFGALQACSGGPAQVRILESGRKTLEKVKISGGGRCNVTHACFDPRELVAFYPRGGKELRGAFHRFGPKDTIAWFAERGVKLKTEEDGRMFPVTDSSSTILDCFEEERRNKRIQISLGASVLAAKKLDSEIFEVTLSNGETLFARNVLLAAGSSRTGHALVRAFGHSLTPLAPSLFTFNCSEQGLRELAGVAAERVKAAIVIGDQKIASSEGPLLVTHWGVSGPAVLKLSAWAARELLQADYHAKLVVDWAPSIKREQLQQALVLQKSQQARKHVVRASPLELPSRLWEHLARRLLSQAADRPWGELSDAMLTTFANSLNAYELEISGKGQFKEEFVTCGGVTLSEVDFRTMQSKLVPGLFFAGEILDIDGVTGGFNFQSAWTTAWIAGSEITARL